MVDLIDSSDDEGIRGRSLALLYQTYLTTDIDDHLTRNSLLVYTYSPRWLLLGCLEVLHSRSLLPARSSSLMRRRGLPGGVDLTQHYFHTMRAAPIHSRCTNCVHVNDYRRRSSARKISLAIAVWRLTADQPSVLWSLRLQPAQLQPCQSASGGMRE